MQLHSVSRLGGVGSRKKDCGKIQDLAPRDPRSSRPDPMAALSNHKIYIYKVLTILLSYVTVDTCSTANIHK